MCNYNHNYYSEHFYQLRKFLYWLLEVNPPTPPSQLPGNCWCPFCIVDWFASSRILFFFNVYLLWERKDYTYAPEYEQGGSEKCGERIPSRFHTFSTEPDMGLDLKNCKIMTWMEIKSRKFNQLSHSAVPSWILKSVFLLNEEGMFLKN